MTNKIDALNDALASIDENVGKLADVANVIVAGSQENQNELKAILEKLQAGQTDVTPQLERAIAINDKLLSLGTALQGAAETIGASDALYDSPEEQLPETPGEG